jgi:hypothetical protein
MIPDSANTVNRPAENRGELHAVGDEAFLITQRVESRDIQPDERKRRGQTKSHNQKTADDVALDPHEASLTPTR